MSLKNLTFSLSDASIFKFSSLPVNLVGKDGEIISVVMRGQSPAAHAEAILAHYKFTKADESKFKELYGFDLRQNLTDAYARKDDKSGHTALGNGLYKVEIPIPKELAAQIRAVKESNRQPRDDSQNIKQAIAERQEFDQSAILRSQLENKLSTVNNLSLPPSAPVLEPVPTPLPVKSEYISVDKVELPTTPENVDKLTITIQTFIPMKHVDGPNNPITSTFSTAIGNFEGDGRDVDQRTVIRNGEPRLSGYRTQQIITADFTMPENIEIPCEFESSRCVMTKETGVSRDLSRWDNKTALRIDKASGETIKATARREGNTIIIEAGGNEVNPLIKGAPGITYNLKIKLEKQADGTITMNTSGLHDGFPGYEVFVSRPGAADGDKKLVYGFDPRKVGNTPMALIGDIFGQTVVSTKTMIVSTAVKQ